MKIPKNQLKKIDKINKLIVCKYCNNLHFEVFQYPEKKRQIEIEKFKNDALCNEFLSAFLIDNFKNLNDKVLELENKILELEEENKSLQR